jgi:hypothetical protein
MLAMMPWRNRRALRSPLPAEPSSCRYDPKIESIEGITFGVDRQQFQVLQASHGQTGICYGLLRLAV